MSSFPASMQVSTRGRRFLNFQEAARAFGQVAMDAEDNAAEAATRVSQDVFQRQRGDRPLAPARRGKNYGRPTTSGQFAQRLLWVPDGDGNVEFDVRKIASAAPYYLIQEIGTNATAEIRNTAHGGPSGTIHVRSQVGRLISSNLYWASSVGAKAKSAKTGAFGDQLFYGSDLDQETLSQVRKRRKRIRREIHGKHFLQAGGFAGFNALFDELSREAQRIFG